MVIRTEVKMDKGRMEIPHGGTAFVLVGQIDAGTFGVLTNEVCIVLFRDGKLEAV